MNFKSLMLVMVFIMAFEICTSIANDKPCKCPCDCIELVADAVDAVIANSYCDLFGIWEAPKDLVDQLINLQNFCTALDKYPKSKASETVDEMLKTIHTAIVGENQTINGKTIIIVKPAPDCAVEALFNLQKLLLYGRPAQVIE